MDLADDPADAAERLAASERLVLHPLDVDLEEVDPLDPVLLHERLETHRLNLIDVATSVRHHPRTRLESGSRASP